MASRLHKEINRQRRIAYCDAVEKWKKDNDDDDKCECEPCDPYGWNILPRPTKIIPNSNMIQVGCKKSRYPPIQTQCGSPIIKSSAGTNNPYDEEDYRMMHKHRLWVRVFDKDDNLLFNHANSQRIYTSLMIQVCTKLVKHMNLISQTNETGVQKALGTFEGTIIGQLALPFNVNDPSALWNDQDPSLNQDRYAIGAIAIIKQEENDIFKGQLIDDYIGITFQL